MQKVEFVYKCQRCGYLFAKDSSLSPHIAKDVMDSHIYGIESSFQTMNEYERHECKCTDSHTVLRIGIGELIGYSVIEIPDSSDSRHLTKVKG